MICKKQHDSSRKGGQDMAKHAGGRPRRNTPEMVDKAVDMMLAEYQETGNISALDDTRLMQILNISPGTLERYYQGKADKALQDEEAEQYSEDYNGEREYHTNERYSEALKKLVAYRRSVCIEHIATDRVTSGWIFLSKQPHWGGFQDVQRTETRGKQEFVVTISGPDGKAIRE